MFLNQHDLILGTLLLIFAGGVSIAFGYFISNSITQDLQDLVEGAEIVRKMAERSEGTVLVADSSKFGKIGFVHVLPVQRVETLITDVELPIPAQAELGKTGVEVIQV